MHELYALIVGMIFYGLLRILLEIYQRICVIVLCQQKSITNLQFRKKDMLWTIMY